MAQIETDEMSPVPLETLPKAKPPTASPLRPNHCASLWAAANAPPKDHARLIMAIAVLVALCIASYPVVRFFHHLRPPRFTLPTHVDEPLSAPSKQAAWVTDAMAAQHEAMPWDPLASRRPAPENNPPKRPRRQNQRPRHTPDLKHEAPPAALAEPPQPSRYAELWGPAERYTAASSMPSSRAAATIPSTDRAGGVQGMLLYARLKDQVASNPAQASVIATLSHKATLNDDLLAAGSEIHGTVTSADDTRIFVTFAFARLSNGRTISLVGSARDLQGRLGIAGQKSLTRKSAGSVGLASATRALQAAGREIAGAAGVILGAGIEGATDAGSDKAKRADNDEYVLIAKPGTALQIYVQSTGETGKRF